MRVATTWVCLIFVLGLILTLAGRFVQAQTGATDNPDFAAIDAYIESEMKAARIPGMALALVQNDQIVYLRGYGVADSTGRAITPQTPFFLGSVSKSFTALAIMQLAETGKVELDAPVQRYLPWFRVADPEVSARITVRHLLNQTSGLPESVGIKGLSDGDSSDDAIERHVRALSHESLTQPIGVAFQYCNSNYTTLGMIVQAVSGQSYEQYIQQRIFDPLEMSHSFTSQAAAQQHGLATGYRQWFGFPIAAANLPYIRGELPAGYLIASAEDMAHYLIAHLNQGRYQQATILSPEGMAELHRPGNAPRVGLSDTGMFDHYAMGWFVGEMSQVPVIYHGGSTPNFRTDVVIQPESQGGIVVLTNTFLPNNLAPGILSLLVGNQPLSVQPYPFPNIEYLVVPVLQIVVFIFSVIAIRRWYSQPEHRPRGRWPLIWRIGLPLVMDVGVIILALWGLSKEPIQISLLFNPGPTWLAILCGSFALIWGTLRTVVSIWGLRVRKRITSLMSF